MRKQIISIVLLTLFVVVGAIGGLYFLSKPKTGKVIDNPFNQATHSSTGIGVDAARVDSQITLKIPEGEADAVYNYLRKTYVESNTLLATAFPNENMKGQDRVDISNFTDHYFDTPDFDFYVNNNSVRHRLRINTTDPTDRKSGRELVQVKITPVGQFQSRTELKFDVQAKEPSLGDPESSHPLLGIVEKKERDNFKEVFADIGVNPLRLFYILTNHQKRSRIYLDHNGVNVLSFSVDEGTSKLLWAKAYITSVDVGLVENVYTAASPEERERLRALRQVVLDDLLRQFPELTVNSEEKYALLLDQLISRVPFAVGFIKLGIH